MHEDTHSSEVHYERSLKFAIWLTLAFFAVEVAGGLISGSLALLGDAGHMLRDFFALFISLTAIRLSRKVPTPARTFGYHRLEIFAAFLNGVMLVGISIWIILEAWQRFSEPPPIKSLPMLGVAVMGLAVNAFIAYKLHGSHDLNIRSAFLHVMTDLVFSLAVIGAALWIYFTGQTIVDPVLSMVIGVVIAVSAVSIIRDSIRILLEYTPKDVDLDQVIQDIESTENVENIHNVHIWSLCSHINAMSAHVLTGLNSLDKIEQVKAEIREKLVKYNIKHAALEFECEACSDKGKLRKLIH
jgi:cobalt-zinc-cadmium efflux system protein